MIELPSGFTSKVVKALAKHGPDPLLAFVLFFIFVGALYHGGVDPFVLLLGLVIIWAGYHVRCVAREKHEEQMMVARVDRLEKSRGDSVRGRQRAKIAKAALVKSGQVEGN